MENNSPLPNLQAHLKRANSALQERHLGALANMCLARHLEARGFLLTYALQIWCAEFDHNRYRKADEAQFAPFHSYLVRLKAEI